MFLFADATFVLSCHGDLASVTWLIAKPVGIKQPTSVPPANLPPDFQIQEWRSCIVLQAVRKGNGRCPSQWHGGE